MGKIPLWALRVPNSLGKIRSILQMKYKLFSGILPIRCHARATARRPPAGKLLDANLNGDLGRKFVFLVPDYRHDYSFHRQDNRNQRKRNSQLLSKLQLLVERMQRRKKCYREFQIMMGFPAYSRVPARRGCNALGHWPKMDCAPGQYFLSILHRACR